MAKVEVPKAMSIDEARSAFVYALLEVKGDTEKYQAVKQLLTDLLDVVQQTDLEIAVMRALRGFMA